MVFLGNIFCLCGLLVSFKVKSFEIISLRKRVNTQNDIVNCFVSQPATSLAWPFHNEFHRRRTSRSEVTLAASSSVAAVVGLTVASGMGIGMERRIVPSGTGILVSLLVSALASNAGWVPSSHVLYDKCWSLILPTSLALLVLSQKTSSESVTTTLNGTPKIQDNEIGNVGLAFVSASLSSFMGCTISFALSRILSPPLWMTPSDAAIAGGCLCASYIGGSVNFFATARHVLIDKGKQDLLSSMAAADLIVMALYLAWLSTAIQNPNRIKTWRNLEDESLQHDDDKIQKDTRFETNSSHDDSQSISMASHSTTTSNLSFQVLGTIGALGLALSLTWISNLCERLILPVAGTSCAMVVMGGSLIAHCISRLSPERRLWWSTLQGASEPLARWTFHAFFSAMGMEAHIGQALRYGPASVLFSGTALILHVIGTLSLNRMLRKFCRPLRRYHPSNARKGLQLHHVLVASNAAIGGPATAAAFAGQQNHPELVIPATFWGVVGYAVGTTIGITSTRWYQSWL
jgi:uncharacterized membrane protein